MSRWFYATDVPKRKVVSEVSEKEKPKLPSKWSAFAPRDSKALETAFQKMIIHPNEPSLPVPVNEDHLFEVDIVARELKPVYFRGSTYEVLRLQKAAIDVGASSRMVLSGRVSIETL